MLSYLEKFIVSKEEIEEIEKKLFDYANLNELCDIMRNIFSSLKEKIDRKLKKLFKVKSQIFFFKKDLIKIVYQKRKLRKKIM